jgi:transposase
MAVELRQDQATKQGAVARVAERLGMHPETLRNWVRQAEIDGGVRAGTTTAEARRIAQLEQEVRELRRANHILKTSAAFFAAELDRPNSR